MASPTLPENHQEQGFMNGSLVIALGGIVAWIGSVSYMTNGRHTKMDELLISQSVGLIIMNFLLPLYFIYRTPNLYQYVKSFFVKPSFMNNQVQPRVLDIWSRPKAAILALKKFWSQLILAEKSSFWSSEAILKGCGIIKMLRRESSARRTQFCKQHFTF